MNAHALDMAAYESLLAFWRDAGVDACYLETPIDHTDFKPLATPAVVQKLAVAHTSRPNNGTTDVSSGLSAARHLANSANDLDSLIEAIKAFEGCALKKMGAKHTLFGRGAANADLLVIGDAPSTDADMAGEAFNSPAGRLLDKILAAANLQDRAYLTHSVFWNPPGNRPPTADEQAVCLPFIERACALIQPKAVLLIGSVAVKGILQTDEPLLKLQGRWREWSVPDCAPLPVMSTFHPGFLLQQPQAKGLVWRDILSVCTRLSDSNVEKQP